MASPRPGGRVLLATLGPLLSLRALAELTRGIGEAAESAGYSDVCIGPVGEITGLPPAVPDGHEAEYDHG